MTVTFTDLFSGAGGATTGLVQAGLEGVTSVPGWNRAVETHTLNHPGMEHRFMWLFPDTDFSAFRRTLVLWASPSCTAHSQAARLRQTTAEDERRCDTPEKVDRAMAFAVVAAARVHRYEVILMENVPGFLNWVLFPEFRDDLLEMGYEMQVLICNAADVGPVPVPQDRERVFLVFSRCGAVDLSLPHVERTVASSILEAGVPLDNPRMRRNYLRPQLDAITELNVPHLLTYRRNAKPRRADQSLLPTLCSGGRHHALGSRTETGDTLRWLTLRELARAQGFPDDYRFLGTDTEIRRQLGNAVAVNVSRFLGERVRAHLNG